MTLDLEAIRARAERARVMGWPSALDLTDLLAEVTSLTAELDRLRESREYYRDMAVERGKIMVAAEATVERQRPVIEAALRQHYLAEIVCDHQRKMDNPWCACSLVNLGWHPSVGDAVQAWVDHVLDALDGAATPGEEGGTP